MNHAVFTGGVWNKWGHSEPCPELGNVILNLFQDQGLRFQDRCLRFLDFSYFLDSESSSE
jgi:hypothetical protein